MQPKFQKMLFSISTVCFACHVIAHHVFRILDSNRFRFGRKVHAWFSSFQFWNRHILMIDANFIIMWMMKVSCGVCLPPGRRSLLRIRRATSIPTSPRLPPGRGVWETSPMPIDQISTFLWPVCVAFVWILTHDLLCFCVEPIQDDVPTRGTRVSCRV